VSVTLEHVTRTVDGIPTIRDVSLTLERGTLSVLLGPTLSGKTSIMRLLAGLDKPATGRVLVEGKDVTGFDVRQRSVAMVYQQFINYPSLTVYENIASPLRLRKDMGRSVIDRRVRETAAALRLDHLLAGDGETVADIYNERVETRGYGSGAWGWITAYGAETGA